MFKETDLIPRAKLTHPAWVLYKDETDYIGRIGTGPMKNPRLPYKPWSDPTQPDVNRFSIFTGGSSEESASTITYWALSPELAPVDALEVKSFYLQNDAWIAYQTILENRFIFYAGVPYCTKMVVPRSQALAANFSRETQINYFHPLKLNVATEPVILLPSYASGKSEVVGITYGAFIRSIPQVVDIKDKLQVIQGILNNLNFSHEDKFSAIQKICTMATKAVDPNVPIGALKAATQRIAVYNDYLKILKEKAQALDADREDFGDAKRTAFSSVGEMQAQRISKDSKLFYKG